MLKTTITGSLPKPTWLSDPGKQLFSPWVVPEPHLHEAQDDAVRLALADQIDAGIDIVTDGEQRRRHYIWGFLEALQGVDAWNLGAKVTRGARYGNTPIGVARLVGEVARPRPVLVEALAFARAHSNKPVKVTLPGPMTIVDSLVDEFYGDDKATLAMRFADILNAEARDLAAGGADVIQFDEPCFNIYVEDVAAWGVRALDRAAAGVNATTAVHICYGYGVPQVLSWKQHNTDWGHYAATLPLLADSSIDQVSIESAASGVDVAVIQTLRGKDVMLGVIDVGSDDIETPDTVAARIRKALPYIDPEHLFPCTDCGMVPRPRQVALGKMASLAAGAAMVRREVSDRR